MEIELRSGSEIEFNFIKDYFNDDMFDEMYQLYVDFSKFKNYKDSTIENILKAVIEENINVEDLNGDKLINFIFDIPTDGGFSTHLNFIVLFDSKKLNIFSVTLQNPFITANKDGGLCSGNISQILIEDEKQSDYINKLGMDELLELIQQNL